MNKDYFKWSETIAIIHMPHEEKNKLFNCTIAKISLQCKFNSLYLYTIIIFKKI